MDNKSIRIRTDIGEDKYVNVNIEQDFDFIEILSLKLTEEDVYRRFCSDYGVVAGRVFINNGFGVKNAKVSIFIPKDETSSTLIQELYPFEVTKDKGNDSKRYNLLPDSNSGDDCFIPVGSFPSKREVLDNDTTLEIFCDYYKFTTSSNDAGDFMLFGIPVGNYTIHVDADISDLGITSVKPYDLISQGADKKFFQSPTKFKTDNNIDLLTQIKSQDIGVNVVPFWGDTDQCEVGITRIDVDLKYNYTPTAMFIGSIFGDNEKKAISKRCKPRKNLGELCDQVTSSGLMEMVRETIDGQVEPFTVEGGRVIDDNGVWAYQIPLNLSPVVTNEFGELVPSDDPNKGIYTEANVRFRVSMNQTGGEGRLRTRASYLVPNNPTDGSGGNYEFDEYEALKGVTNNPNYFSNLKWNKLYTVRNYIPRFQRNKAVENRNFTGIKDVDNCGDHTPFPFNRADTDLNPLFLIICLILTIIVTLVVLINSIIVPIVNVIIDIVNILISVVNTILSILNAIIGAILAIIKAIAFLFGGSGNNIPNPPNLNVPPISPLKCITLSCQSTKYAIGCFQDKAIPTDGTVLAPNDGNPGTQCTLGTFPPCDAGFMNCISLSLAESLNVYKYDFYNDWVNGSLYLPLLKYKKKRNDKEKFCEYDCDDFDGDSDNNCRNRYLVDSCAPGKNGSNGVNSSLNQVIREGLVKKKEDFFYYAAKSHSSSNILHATDITCLGSIVNCDLDGYPILHNKLLNTSYNIPPLVSEYELDSTGNPTGDILVNGVDNPGIGAANSLFFNASCVTFETNQVNCSNLRRICEIGLGLDEDRTDEQTISPNCTNQTGGGNGKVDNFINNCDIDNTFIRSSLMLVNGLNKPLSIIESYFDKINYTDPNPDGPYPTQIQHTDDYNDYRGFDDIGGLKYIPTKNSFYFYFGINPGKSALDKLRENYFTDCNQPSSPSIIIDGVVTDVTTIGGTDGAIDITVEGGVGPYSYFWNGPNGFTSQSEDLTNIPAGTYTVTVTDDTGVVVSSSFNVGQPLPIIYTFDTTDVTSPNGSNGSIFLSQINGGDPSVSCYDYQFKISGGTYTTLAPVGGTPPNCDTEILIDNLVSGTYVVNVCDGNGSCTETTMVVEEPTPIVVTTTTVDILCNGQTNGELSFSINGGVQPYTYQIEDSNNNVVGDNVTSLINLPADTYTITVVDSSTPPQSSTTNVVISEPPELEPRVIWSEITCNGAADGNVDVFIIPPKTGTPPYDLEISADQDGVLYSDNNWDGSIINQPLTSPQLYTVEVIDANGCSFVSATNIREPEDIVVSLLNFNNPTTGATTSGSITVNVDGGNPDIDFGDNSNNLYYVNLLETNTNTQYQEILNFGINVVTFDNLPAGNYEVTATDKNNCPSNTLNRILIELPI